MFSVIIFVVLDGVVAQLRCVMLCYCRVQTAAELTVSHLSSAQSLSRIIHAVMMCYREREINHILQAVLVSQWSGSVCDGLHICTCSHSPVTSIHHLRPIPKLNTAAAIMVFQRLDAGYNYTTRFGFSKQGAWAMSDDLGSLLKLAAPTQMAPASLDP